MDTDRVTDDSIRSEPEHQLGGTRVDAHPRRWLYTGWPPLRYLRQTILLHRRCDSRSYREHHCRHGQECQYADWSHGLHWLGSFLTDLLHLCYWRIGACAPSLHHCWAYQCVSAPPKSRRVGCHAGRTIGKDGNLINATQQIHYPRRSVRSSDC